MTRKLVRLLIGTILVVAIPVAIPAPAGALDYRTDCAPMTDSITRLYEAFFDREPDTPGFNMWVEKYRSGQETLAGIADGFVESEEFAAKNLQSNRTFVNWIYTNVLDDSEPDPDDVETWVKALDNGLSRGAVMVNFTESERFVLSHGSTPPLAGFNKTYPAGTHWYCNIGSETVAVQALTGEEVWADYYFKNRGSESATFGLWTLEGGRANVRMAADTLRPGFTNYNWHGVFRGDGSYGDSITVQAESKTQWIVVFYPESIGERRRGWEP